MKKNTLKKEGDLVKKGGPASKNKTKKGGGLIRASDSLRVCLVFVIVSLPDFYFVVITWFIFIPIAMRAKQLH